MTVRPTSLTFTDSIAPPALPQLRSEFDEALARLRERSDASQPEESRERIRPGTARRGPRAPAADEPQEPDLDSDPEPDPVPEPVSWRRRRLPIPGAGPKAEEFAPPSHAFPTLHSPLWRIVSAELLRLATGGHDAVGSGAVDAGTRLDGAVTAAALDWLLDGPAMFESLVGIAASGAMVPSAVGAELAQLDPSDVDGVIAFVHAQVAGRAAASAAGIREATAQVAAWIGALDPSDRAAIAGWLVPRLVDARSESAGFEAVTAAAERFAVADPPAGSGAGRSRDAFIASVRARSAGRENGSGAAATVLDDAVALIDLVHEGLSSEALVAILPSSCDGDRLALSVVIELAVLVDQAVQADRPEALVAYAGSALRATHLLQLGSIGGIGPLGYASDGSAVIAPVRSGLTVFFGPPGSGKTSVLNTVAASHSGPLVATTSKLNDWADSFVPVRAARAPLWVFDPGGTATTSHPGALRVRWDLVSLCTDFEKARRFAYVLGKASMSYGVTDMEFWNTLAQLMLGPLLLAAARSEGTIADVSRWSMTGTALEEAQRLLADRGEAEAHQQLTSFVDMDSRTRDSVQATVQQVIAPFTTGSAARLAVEGEPFDPTTDLIGEDATLLLCLDHLMTANLAPMVAAFLDWVIYERIRLADRGWSGPHLLLAGDEIANIAPLPGLPRLLAEGPGRGIQAVLCLQDPAQAADRWGRLGGLFLTAAGHRVFFPGVTNVELMAWIQPLISAENAPIGGFGRPLRSATRRRPSGTSDVARPGVGRATVVTPETEVLAVRQARAFEDPVYRQALLESRAVVTACQAMPADRDVDLASGGPVE